jgi:hypothetical protein
METCASCGAEAKNLLRAFVGDRLDERLPFCLDCVEFGACELPLLVQARVDGQSIVRSAVSSNRAILRALRRSRVQAAALQESVNKLQEKLRGQANPWDVSDAAERIPTGHDG